MRTQLIKWNDNSLFLIFLILICVSQILFGEVIPINNGYGWDGVYYGEVTKRFPELLINKDFDTYRIQRILPSVIIHYSLKLFNLPFEDNIIIKGWQIFNSLMLLMSCYLWIMISRVSKFEGTVKWFGFIALFVNFAFLKMSFYYSVLTDVSGFALGLMALYAFLSEKKILVLFTIFIGLFTWPIISFASSLIYITGKLTYSKIEINKNFPLFVSSCFSFLFTMTAIYLHFFKGIKLPASDTIETSNLFAILGIVVMAAFLFFGLYTLLQHFPFTKLIGLITKKLIIRCLIVLILLGVIIILQKHFSALPKVMDSKMLFKTTILRAIAKPFVFFICHFMYFGPVLCLMVFFWKRIVAEIKGLGVGLLSFIILNFILSLNSESRILVHFFPFMVFIVALVISKLEWKAYYNIVFLLIGIIVSKIWYPINQETFIGNLYEFPYQNIFMNLGPWLSNKVYFIYLISFFVTMFLIKKIIIQNVMVKKSEKLFEDI